MISESLLLLSEIILSAYPSLIKLVDSSIILQTGARMLTFTALAATAAAVTGNPIQFFSLETIYIGLLNLLHVGASYTAFTEMAGGNAIALFYTYPIWNILGAAALFGEVLSLETLPWLGLALLGMILLAHPSANKWTIFGIIMALTAALTETGIYLWFRARNLQDDSPWTKMVQMFGSSSILWGLGIGIAIITGILSKAIFKISNQGLTAILLFNACFGFLGYALRFYLIPKVPTVLFSSLSFFGIVAAYVMGWLFSNEIPSILQMAGAAAIIAANAVLLSKDTSSRSP